MMENISTQVERHFLNLIVYLALPNNRSSVYFALSDPMMCLMEMVKLLVAACDILWYVAYARELFR